jgi:adenine-specific DNA-methyltransferase
MAKRPARNRSAAARRIDEALAVLASLNVPKEQQNERSALVLLALLGMTPRKEWSAATNPMLGITEMMDVFRDQFGKRYAPNTRETVRRFTVHQFVQMGSCWRILTIHNVQSIVRPIVTRLLLRS